jgi:hypothetical protein
MNALPWTKYRLERTTVYTGRQEWTYLEFIQSPSEKLSSAFMIWNIPVVQSSNDKFQTSS